MQTKVNKIIEMSHLISVPTVPTFKTLAATAAKGNVSVNGNMSFILVEE